VPLIRHPDVRRMLLAQKAYAGGALALCLYAARLSDDERSLEDVRGRREAQQLLDLLTPVVKSWSSQWGTTANDLAIQVHGGYGYTREYNVEQFYRDNRLNAIHEGTFGIQALDLLGRKTRIDNGAGLELLGRRIEATVRATAGSGTLAAHSRALEDAWTKIRVTTKALHAIADLDASLANAAAYLEAFGHVVVAWLWLDQARLAAAALAAATGPEQDFYRGKLAACAYFYAWELPRVAAWLSVLEPLDRTLLDTPEAAL